MQNKHPGERLCFNLYASKDCEKFFGTKRKLKRGTNISQYTCVTHLFEYFTVLQVPNS